MSEKNWEEKNEHEQKSYTRTVKEKKKCYIIHSSHEIFFEWQDRN